MCRVCQRNVINRPPVNRTDIKCTCTWRQFQVERKEDGGQKQTCWMTYPFPCFTCLRILHRLHPTEANIVVDVYGNRYKMAVPPAVMRDD